MAIPKKGDIVRQIMPEPIVGVVTEYVVCQEEGTVSLKVEWPDANGDGVPESRFFKVSEVETVPAETVDG